MSAGKLKRPEREGSRAHGDGTKGTAPDRNYSAPATLSARRRWAPYAKHVTDLQRAGVSPNCFLFAGYECWKQAEYRRRTHGDGSALVLPPNESPHGLRWPRLDALTAIPGDCGGERFRDLVLALLIAGTRCIVEVRPDQAPACHYASADDALEVAA